MTHRERMLAAVEGRVPDRLPFAPRLEFWHRARLRGNTLPEELRGLTLDEISDYLGAARYAVVPDMTQHRSEHDTVDTALGLHFGASHPFETRLDDTDRRVTRRGTEVVVEYHTPLGSIRTATILTEEMLDAGVSVPWVTRHAIEGPEDFEVVGYLFEHLRVIPRLDCYEARKREVGEKGLAVCSTSGSACPIQHIMKALMPVDRFFYALHDYPEKVEKLAAQMEPFYSAIESIAADSSAEVVMLGGNYDDAITYPPFFAKYILPALHSYAERLHARGKYLMTHTDGENRKLLKLYREAGFDVADSVCPYPMTSCRLEEIREAFADRITILGGIPSVLLCRDSATEDQFRRFIDDLIARYSGQSRLILGVSDMVTADAEWSRLRYLSERTAAGR
jgi:hypothetical protein